MLGGEAAAKAGFTMDEASQSSPLWADGKKSDEAPRNEGKDEAKGYQSSTYV